MASKSDMLRPFVRRICKGVLDARITELVGADQADLAKVLADNQNLLISRIGCEFTRTYALLELEDIVKWRKRKKLDFEKQRET